MPNLSVAIYLTDDDYVKYVKHKVDINKLIREEIKKELKKR